MRGPVLLAAMLASAVLFRCGDDGGPSGSEEGRLAEGERITASVSEVIDGDTIEVILLDGSEEDVRYIGIDTPETVKPGQPVECGGPKASRVNERLVGGREVELRFDAETRDRYGRLLAYVYVPRPGGRDLFVNAEMVRRGLARTLTIEPNDARAPLLARLEGAAGRSGRGLWSACPP